MDKYAYIEFWNVPGHFPTAGFVERIELPVDQFRVTRAGVIEEKIMTEERWETTLSDVPRQQIIRVTTYDVYKCTLIVNEFQNIQLLGLANDVKVSLEDGSTHTAIITEISQPEKVGNSDWQKIVITYYDTNPDNYIGGNVNDYITSAAILENYEPGELHKLRVKTDGSVCYVYTLLETEKFISEVQETNETFNGITKNSRVIIQTGYKLRFYISEAEMITLRTRLAKFTPGKDDEIKFTIAGTASNYYAIERMTPEIEKIDFDLYKVDLSLKYSSETFNNYY